MLNRINFQLEPEILTPEQMAEKGCAFEWNYCLCQAFQLIVDKRPVYMLNVSGDATGCIFYLEYAIVVPLAVQSIEDGFELVTGLQIDSLTVNGDSMTPERLAEILRVYGDPSKDEYNFPVSFILGASGKHSCGHCR
jgi:hypothetical protein